MHSRFEKTLRPSNQHVGLQDKNGRGRTDIDGMDSSNGSTAVGCGPHVFLGPCGERVLCMIHMYCDVHYNKNVSKLSKETTQNLPRYLNPAEKKKARARCHGNHSS